MNKFLGISILGLAAALAGCGGDSDSSGSSQSEKFHFGNLPYCKVSNDTINVTSAAFGCKVQTPKLNKGKVFSLSCSGGYSPSSGFNLPAKFTIKALSNGDIESIKHDIRHQKHFKYVCINKIVDLS